MCVNPCKRGYVNAFLQWRIQRGRNRRAPPLHFDRLYIFLFQFCIRTLQNKSQIALRERERASNLVPLSGPCRPRPELKGFRARNVHCTTFVPPLFWNPGSAPVFVCKLWTHPNRGRPQMWKVFQCLANHKGMHFFWGGGGEGCKVGKGIHGWNLPNHRSEWIGVKPTVIII